eukprot:1311808-Rhodomonas_salina.2
MPLNLLRPPSLSLAVRLAWSVTWTAFCVAAGRRGQQMLSYAVTQPEPEAQRFNMARPGTATDS